MTIEELYRRYRGHIFLLCRRYVRDTADAEDVVQMVFVKAWRSLGRFENRSDPFTWLYRIAVNECLNYLKKHRREVVEFDESKWAEGSAHRLDHGERILLWRRVLDGFDRKDRMIILLIAFQGLTMTEAAEVSGLSRQGLYKKWHALQKSVLKRVRGIL